MAFVRFSAALALMFATVMFGQQQHPQDFSRDTVSRITLADFAWMAGDWTAQFNGGVLEQHWFAPSAGTMIGSMRFVRNDQVRTVELYSAKQMPEGVKIWTRQFDSTLQPIGSGDVLIATAIEATPDRVVLSGGSGKITTRTTIQHIGDTMTHQIEITGASPEPRVMTITYHRTVQ